MSETPTPTPENNKRGGITAGIILILVGIFALAANYIKTSGELFMGLLALVFIAAAFLRRNQGLLIPGGILAGIAAGIYLMEGPYKNIGDPAQGGIFLLAFAGGWVLITLMSLVMSPMTGKGMILWPLIPGGVLALVGGLLVAGNMRALELVGQGWPIILIIIGVAVLLRRREPQN